MIGLGIDEVEAGHRGVVHVRFARFPVDGLGRTVLQVAQKLGKDFLGLIQHEMGHARNFCMKRGGMGASGHHGHAGPVAPLDHGLQGVSLHDHGGSTDQIGPLQVRVLQGRHVQIHDAEVIVGREHRGDGKQTQRGKSRLDPKELQRKVRSPVRRGMFRVHQKRTWHGYGLLRPAESADSGFFRGF